MTGERSTIMSTQYDQDQTPTIEDCALKCRINTECEGIGYGTESGEETDHGTSDGGRAKDCVMLTDAQYKLTNSRWKTYSVKSFTKMYSGYEGNRRDQTWDYSYSEADTPTINDC